MQQKLRMFWPQIFLGDSPPPNFWTCIVNRTQISMHVVKFHGDRLRELGDLVAN